MTYQVIDNEQVVWGDGETAARPVDDDDLARWEVWAAAAALHLLAGSVNWPMMVRSLVEEVRRLKRIVGE